MQKFTKDNLPTEGWTEYKKKGNTPMMPIDGEFEVETQEGTLVCRDGFLAIDAAGWPYPIDRAIQEKSYEKA